MIYFSGLRYPLSSEIITDDIFWVEECLQTNIMLRRPCQQYLSVYNVLITSQNAFRVAHHQCFEVDHRYN